MRVGVGVELQVGIEARSGIRIGVGAGVGVRVRVRDWLPVGLEIRTFFGSGGSLERRHYRANLLIVVMLHCRAVPLYPHRGSSGGGHGFVPPCHTTLVRFENCCVVVFINTNSYKSNNSESSMLL